MLEDSNIIFQKLDSLAKTPGGYRRPHHSENEGKSKVSSKSKVGKKSTLFDTELAYATTNSYFRCHIHNINRGEKENTTKEGCSIC